MRPLGMQIRLDSHITLNNGGYVVSYRLSVLLIYILV